METTKCRKCNQPKNITEFYKSDKNTCKNCIKARVKKYRKDNIAKVMEYDRNRPNAKERNKKHLNRMKNLPAEKKSEYKKRKDETTASSEYKNKKTVNTYLDNAIRDKRKEKGTECEHCGEKDIPLDGHHPSYLKPLDVAWLCKPCHGAEHKRLNAIKRGSA